MNYYTSTPTRHAMLELFNEYDPTETWETAPSTEEVVKALWDIVNREIQCATDFACSVMRAFFADVDFEEIAENIIDGYYPE